MKKRIEKMIPTVLSLAIALFFGSFLFMAVGYNPVSVYSEIIYGAVGTHGAVLNSLVQATPLLFTGLAFVIAIRGGIANIGGEGQLYAGALGSVLAGIFLKDIPAYIHIPLSSFVRYCIRRMLGEPDCGFESLFRGSGNYYCYYAELYYAVFCEFSGKLSSERGRSNFPDR